MKSRTPIFFGESEVSSISDYCNLIGGGGNFGVVYQFVVRIHPHPGTCFGGFMLHTPDKIPQVVSAFHKFWTNVNPKCSCHIVVSAMPPENVVSDLLLEMLKRADGYCCTFLRYDR